MPDDATPMTLEQAKEINDRLVTAWMIRERLMASEELPGFHDITLDQAMEATRRAIQSNAPAPGEGGLRTYTCHIELTRVPRLYAWAILKAEGIPFV